jgi:hypothetical protein
MLVTVNTARAVVWTKPEDLDLSTTDAVEAIRGIVPGRCVVGFADGSVRFMPCELPEEFFPRSLFMAYFTRAGGERLPSAEMPDAELIKQWQGRIHPLDEIRLGAAKAEHAEPPQPVSPAPGGLPAAAR